MQYMVKAGMTDAQAIQSATNAAREGCGKELGLLSCVNGYPASAEVYNLLSQQELI
jgi:sialic acid synthase SpsE